MVLFGVEPLPPSRPILIVVRGPVASSGPLACDVARITEPDEVALDALARLQLAAQRLGVSIRLHNAGAALVDLLDLAGLSDVLVVAESGVEPDRKVEEREEVGVDEEVHRGDDAG
jgi:ABC-type transporter Mla MlaB component